VTFRISALHWETLMQLSAPTLSDTTTSQPNTRASFPSMKVRDAAPSDGGCCPTRRCSGCAPSPAARVSWCREAEGRCPRLLATVIRSIATVGAHR
jgi:hypothetical protein